MFNIVCQYGEPVAHLGTESIKSNNVIKTKQFRNAEKLRPKEDVTNMAQLPTSMSPINKMGFKIL